MKPTITLINTIAEARAIGLGRAFRAPHFTVSERVIVEEVAMAAGGVLLLDEPTQYNRACLTAVLRVVSGMQPSVRPVVCAIVRTDDPETLEEIDSRFEAWDRQVGRI